MYRPLPDALACRQHAVRSLLADTAGSEARRKSARSGMSNHDAAQLEAAERLGHVDTLQPPFSTIRREAAAAILPWCVAHNTGVIVYSVLQSGLLTGSFKLSALPQNDWRTRGPDYNVGAGSRIRRRAVASEPSAGGSAEACRSSARGRHRGGRHGLDPGVAGRDRGDCRRPQPLRGGRLFTGRELWSLPRRICSRSPTPSSAQAQAPVPRCRGA